jgi:hypothetical protein
MYFFAETPSKLGTWGFSAGIPRMKIKMPINGQRKIPTRPYSVDSLFRSKYGEVSFEQMVVIDTSLPCLCTLFFTGHSLEEMCDARLVIKDSKVPPLHSQ